MKKPVALLLAVLLMLSTVSAFAEVYKDKPTVKAVQQALNDAGYNCGTPDGSAGKKTKAAVTQFQTDKGLEVTGQIDDALLEALGIATGEPEAQYEEQVESADDTVPASSAEESQIDWSNVNAVAQLYHTILLDELANRGVDINNELIDGVESYFVNKAFGLSVYSADGTIYIGWNEEPKFAECSLHLTSDVSQSDSFEVNFLESTVIAAAIRLMNAYLDPNEEILALEDTYLNAVPDRDGKLALNTDDFSFYGDDGYAVLSCSVITDEDDVILTIYAQ